jgi:hypothetical protein
MDHNEGSNNSEKYSFTDVKTTATGITGNISTSYTFPSDFGSNLNGWWDGGVFYPYQWVYPYQYVYPQNATVAKTVDELLKELEIALTTEKYNLEKEVKESGKRKVRMDSVKKLMREVDELKDKLK